MLCCTWNLSSPARNGTCNPALEVQSLNHWATGGSPSLTYSKVDLVFMIFLLNYSRFLLPSVSNIVKFCAHRTDRSSCIELHRSCSNFDHRVCSRNKILSEYRCLSLSLWPLLCGNNLFPPDSQSSEPYKIPWFLFLLVCSAVWGTQNDWVRTSVVV